METIENDEAPKTKKDFIWLLIGAIVLIAALLLLKSLMHHFGLLG